MRPVSQTETAKDLLTRVQRRHGCRRWREVAALLGVSEAQVSSWLRGRSGMSRLRREKIEGLLARKGKP